MPVEGTVLDGKYELIRLLGKGGMGEVWEAERVGLHRRVAVKFLLCKLAESRDARARFLAEAKVSGRIDHDNICEVLDLGVDEHEALYYVMPLLRGEPLDAALETDAPIDIERACDIVFQVLAGLSAAHRAGIVHRDLKPENIFLTTIGDRHDFVKVLDFGIAKALGTTTWKQKEATLTNTGAVMGTPYYMAPEQARGAKDIDGRVDIYSVGVMLYEMLTGVRPVDGDSPNEVFWNIWLGTIALPTTHRPDLPVAIEDVVMGAMARKCDERYATADDLRQALYAALEATGLEVRTSWRPTRSERPAAAPARPVSTDPDGEAIPDAVTEPGADESEPPPAVPAEPEPDTPAELEPDTPAEPEPEIESTTPTIDPDAQTVMGATTLADAGISSTTRSPLVLGVFVIVGCALAAFLALSFTGSGDVAVGPDENAERADEARPPAAAAAEEAEPAVAPAPARLPSVEVTSPVRATITLDGVPEGAAVFVDGERIHGASFEMPPGRTVHVVVQVAGYQPWVDDLHIEADSTVAVRLERARPAGPVKARPQGDRPAGKRRPNTPVVTSFGEMP